MNDKTRLGYILSGIFFTVMMVFWLNPVFVVEPGYQAIIFNPLNGGLQRKIYQDGVHFKIPFVEQVITYETREQVVDIKTQAASKDLQDVQVEMRILYSPMPGKLVQLHKNLGLLYADIKLPSITKELLKAVIANKTAEEIITQRADVSQAINRAVTERAAKSNIKIYDVALTEVKFSPVFTEAIEKKQVAQQEFEASKKLAQAAIEKARGEAEAARIINESSRNSPAFIELRRIEAQKEIAKILSSSSNVVYLPSNTVLMTNPLPGTSSK